MVPNSSLFSLFSTNSFTTELLTPRVAIDFNIAVKFLKLPVKAIPEVPKKTEIIFEEKTPNTKLTATDIEFIDSTLIKGFFFSF